MFKVLDLFVIEYFLVIGLDHPCIIKIKEVIQDCRFMVLVLEYAKGGELFDYVVEDFHSKQPFDERAAKLQFYQVSDVPTVWCFDKFC